MGLELLLAVAITILLSWTPPDICMEPTPSICQWALVGANWESKCVLLFATHAYITGSHWHIPEETYSLWFILVLWFCVVGCSIGTIGGIALQASAIMTITGKASVTANVSIVSAPPSHVLRGALVNASWYCDTGLESWVRKDGDAIIVAREEIANNTSPAVSMHNITASNDLGTNTTDPLAGTSAINSTIPSEVPLLRKMNLTWRIDTFHRKVIIAFGLSVHLKLLTIVSACLYESMIRALCRAEEAMRIEEEALGQREYSKELKQWEAARRRSGSVSRVVPKRWR
ncbi:hypothetical protein K458DRAFT_392086 [Lentithecium fluviatile CBS 122367]|uniref:Uncharacterized protein n=1 Tax=Lentithecium fluviatile CBS 122367 TaxID=1168545 RepID=A0A6G1ITL6_9PLEO|nr:hypothetical protein K458DRAFT_392086 [Lentithecium fluviatile CBS 122367]